MCYKQILPVISIYILFFSYVSMRFYENPELMSAPDPHKSPEKYKQFFMRTWNSGNDTNLKVDFVYAANTIIYYVA